MQRGMEGDIHDRLDLEALPGGRATDPAFRLTAHPVPQTAHPMCNSAHRQHELGCRDDEFALGILPI